MKTTNNIDNKIKVFRVESSYLDISDLGTNQSVNIPWIFFAGLCSINLTASDKRKITGSLHKDILHRSKKRLCKFSRNVIYN